jgi:hypothetical protein
MHRFGLFGFARMGELRIGQDVANHVQQLRLLDRQGAEQRVHDPFLGEKARILSSLS